MPSVSAWSALDAALRLRVPTDVDDKYSRGVVGLRTGSAAYPGAAILGVEAAARAGAGMVRYLGPADVGRMVLSRRPETVLAAGRVQVWVVGSGTDAAHRSADEEAAVREVLRGDLPVVVDAGALDLVPGATAPIVVTPHGREFSRLRQVLGLSEVSLGDAAARQIAAEETARLLGGTVLLKGAETIIATPGGWITTVRAGTPWLSTAGTGDVLAGVLGAIIGAASAPITPEELGPLAATAAWVHGAAGRAAAGIASWEASSAETGHPLVALEVAEAVSSVIGDLLAGRHG